MDKEPSQAPPPSVSFTVPLLPPTVNHYKTPYIAVRGPRAGKQCFSVSAEAQAFKDAIAIFARGATLIPPDPREHRHVRYGLYITIVFGPNDRGDGDNFWKVIADGLKDAGVIHSDARVKVWHLELVDDERDRGPCTEVLCLLQAPMRERRLLNVRR